MIPVVLSNEAIGDIDEIVEYLSNNAAVARRFLDRMELIVDILGDRPSSGMHVRVERPDLTSVYWKHVPGFRQYLVFYSWENDAVRILRVFHSSRDWMDQIRH